MSAPTSTRADQVVIGISGFVALVVGVVAFVGEATPEWADSQDEVQRIVAERVGSEKAAGVPTGLRQIWIPELGRVDRCITCHTTIDWGEELADVLNPARSHPHPELMRAHPVEIFGCTLCHGGQGAATTKDAAHGNVAFWEEPLLDTRRAEQYGLTRAELMERNCNMCHQHQAEVQGMPLLNEAKQIVVKRRCARCHRIHGEGATRAPDLTREGDKHPSQFHFPEGWFKQRTALQWHIDHFLDPQAMSPNSMMPKYRITDREAAALSLLVLSWRDLALPPRWTPDR